MFYPSNSGFGNAASALAESILDIPNIELVIITTTELPPQSEEFKGAKVYRVTRDGGLLVKFIDSYFVKKFLYKFGLDGIYLRTIEHAQYRLGIPYFSSNELALVWFETAIYPFIGSKIARKFPQKTVVRIHATEDAELLAYSNEFLFKKKSIKARIFEFCRDCKVILATNPYHIEFFKRVLLKENTLDIWDKYYYGVVRNSLDVAAQSTEDTVKKYPGISGEYCLTLGRLSSTQGWSQKGFGDLITTLGILHKKEQLPDSFKLVIVGSGSEESRLRSLVQKANLEKYVKHISSTTREETMSLVQNSKFLVLPSHFEGQSIFLIEGLAMGKPLLITSNTGASDMVIEESNGLVVPIGDVQALGGALNRLWSLNPTELMNMGKVSKTLYEETYSKKSATLAIKDMLDILYWNAT
jgi:glycosyltransferase involved in cell wall biosynthesis